jgi:hypothetical protein
LLDVQVAPLTAVANDNSIGYLMNPVPIIRKDSYKNYLANGIAEGFVVGVIFFVLSLLNNSVLKSIYFGFGMWLGIIIIFMGIGFPSEEYFKRKKRIKKLLSEKYSFLNTNRFTLDPDLFFEGIYREYYFRVVPMTSRQQRKKEIDYDIIEAFYSFSKVVNDVDKEKRMTGEYFIGKFYFANNCVEFLPKDWENPHFKENFDGLVGILKAEGLRPIQKNDWEILYGNKLTGIKEDEEKSRTRRILKIGKLDIKYIKPKK